MNFFQELHASVANGHPVSRVVEGSNGTGHTVGHGVSTIIPAMRFSWEISNVDSVFTNGLARVNDLSKEAMLQAIKDKDLRFLAVSCWLLGVSHSVDLCWTGKKTNRLVSSINTFINLLSIMGTEY